MNAPEMMRRQFMEAAPKDWGPDPEDWEDGDGFREFYELCKAENGEVQDAEEDFRCSGDDTGIECKDSIYYESKSVARKLDNGQWVGWTYWYGGGKHGSPEAIDWIDEAYFLDVEEKEVLKVEYTFKKREPEGEEAKP